jgi:predicted CXXCH cytochrome family protein
VAAVAAALGAALVAPQRGAMDPHGAAERCEACHFGPPPPAAQPPSGQAASPVRYGLRYARERLVCERCHVEQGEQSHPVEVKATLSVPKGWPLDAKGRLMCSTCHDPHRSRREAKGGAGRHLLRAAAAGPALCQSCHEELTRSGSRAWHVLATRSAHGEEPKPRETSHGMLDPLSARCLACHDGTVARDVGARLGVRRLGVRRSSSHPVGVSYASRPGRRRDHKSPRLRGEAGLDKRVRLFGGKVGCGSCHNVFSRNEDFLVIDPANGRLCRACHQI